MDLTKSSTELTVSLKVEIQQEAMKKWAKAINDSLGHLLLAGINPDDISYRDASDLDGPCVYIFVKGNAVIKHTFKYVIHGETPA